MVSKSVPKYSRLDASRIIETHKRLAERIEARFPTSGLKEVAKEIQQVAEDAAEQSELIRRKAVGLRIGVGIIVLIAVILAIIIVSSLEVKSDFHSLLPFVEFVEAVLGIIVFLGAAALFLFTLEVRLKRKRALSALHTLRAFANVVDMHQLTKDPERILHRHSSTTASVTMETTQSLFDLNRYLSYCTELLSVLSKIAPLYVQDFPDAFTVSAVDQVESLCARLAQKIWQKLSIVERMLDEQKNS